MEIVERGAKQFQTELLAPLETGGDYVAMLHHLAGTARVRIQVALFRIEIRPAFDSRLLIRGCLDVLCYAKWRGLEVKVLLCGSKGDLRRGNAVAAQYLAARQIEVRRPLHSSLHSKFVLFDDRDTLIGSQNWSPTGLEKSDEIATYVQSGLVARRLSRHFGELWSDSVSWSESDAG